MDAHITIESIDGPVSVAAGSTLLGESRNALELFEAGHAPVVYFPREDIDVARLVRTKLATKCPWKGQASYYSIQGQFSVLANAGWSYQDPLPGMERIAGYLAFYPDRVTITRG